MTDTGQVPGEGLPENAGMVEQPGVVAPDAYTYLSEAPAEDEDLLLPGAQGAWGNEVAPPAPEPVVEAVHQPDAHEMSGRDSGSVDLGGVRLPEPAPAAPSAPRRPLHLGPPIPDASASPVRSLADRGPAGAPVRPTGPQTAGPEYLDVPRSREMPPQGAVPWNGQPPVGAGVTPGETVVPPMYQQPEPVGAAQAAVGRLAAEAGASGHGEAYAAQVWPPGAPSPDASTTDTPAMASAGPVDGAGEPAAMPTAVPVPGAETASGSGPDAEVVAGPEQTAGASGGPVESAGAPSADGPEPVPAQAATPDDRTPVAVPIADAVPGVMAPDAGAAAVQPADAAAPAAEAAGFEAPRTQQPGPAPVEAPAAADAATPAPEAIQAQGTVAPEAPHVVAPDAAQAPAAAVSDPAQGPAPAVTEPPHAPESGQPEALPVSGPQLQAVDAAPADAVPVGPADVHAVPAADPTAPPQSPQQPDTEHTMPPAHDTHQDAVGVDVPEVSGHAVAEPSGPVPDPAGPSPDTAPDAQAPAVAPATDPAEQAADAVAATPVPEPQPAEAPAPSAGPPAEDEGVPADAGQPQGVPADAVPAQPLPDQSMGRFVPVDGSVPTTPHLAPTPPHPVVLPSQEQGPQTAPVPDPVPLVPAPREADTEPAPELLVEQRAEDLDTRAADQDAVAAEVYEARRSTGPAAPAYDEAERAAVLKVMRERRDIRNGFRSDPIPHEVLLRVLEAAHTAPSVGHSQPWDFVVIRSAETRRAMLDLALRQRDAYAKSLPKGRAKQFKELKIEAILDTPVNIVVTADPTRGGRHTLGRHTQPQMAPYSSALAVENLWLAARAEGLGVGWVSFFDEREMVRVLGLPEHLEVVAYLCVGYVDEFPDEPELMQAGWSKRRPLSWVVHEETYGRRALPGEEPHDLLGETVAQIRPLDAKALGEAWERQKRMTKPAGALGMLEIISAQLSGLSRQCPPPIPEPAAVAIFAGDHGVHAQGVTPWPQEVTAQMVANFLGGGAVCNAFASQVGAEVCIVDVGVAADLPATPGLLPRKVRPGTGDMTTGPAMTREEARQAIEVGIETARDLVAAGNKALLTGEMGIANTTASAALISVFTDTDPAEVTGRGTGINDETLARKTEVVRRAVELHQPDPADPIGVLAAIGGLEHAAMVGLLLGGASLRTPVILDGVSAGAAALVARAIAPEVLAACIAGHRSAEPGHVAALNKLGLRPLVDLDLRLGEGTGALLALPMVQSTARAMHEVATFDSAGVTEK